MIERDFSDLLMTFGIDEDTAKRLENEVNGNDLTSLVNDLSGNSVDINSANTILQKYNVQISDNDEDITNEMYENIMNGNSIFENLKIIEDKDILDEDYQYVVNLDKKGVDPLIDYLDDNNINYFFNGKTEFKIDCIDRSQAYSIDRFISKIKPNETLRDNTIHIEPKKVKQKTMENRNMNKQRKKLKESSMLYSPEVIQMVSNAGLDMKRLAEAFDDMDDYSDDMDVDTTTVDDNGDIDTDYDFTSPDGDDVDVDVDTDGLDDTVDVTDPTVDDYAVDNVADTMAYDNSDAYTVITNSINDITNNLGNLKVSEFKMIIDSLTGLLDTAKDSGRTYLD